MFFDIIFILYVITLLTVCWFSFTKKGRQIQLEYLAWCAAHNIAPIEYPMI